MSITEIEVIKNQKCLSGVRRIRLYSFLICTAPAVSDKSELVLKKKFEASLTTGPEPERQHIARVNLGRLR